MSSKRSGLHKPVAAIFTRAVMPEEVRPAGMEPPVQPAPQVPVEKAPQPPKEKERVPEVPQARPQRPRPRPRKGSKIAQQVQHATIQLPLLRPGHGPQEHTQAGLGRLVRAFLGWIKGGQG